ncbi:MAG: FAD-dependent oxidoreductase, partial [Candidatus Bathyarchaeia archaeon]
MKKNVDVAVIGGGPAGLAAAISARQEGAARVIVFERNAGLGGILQQCIHTGFGTRILNADLTGPEYAERFIEEVEKNNIEVEVETMVLDVYPSRVECVNRQNGPFSVDAKSVVLAMGCRERPCGALRIPGTRPAGIFTAGTAQWYVNVFGYVPGNRVVILGSGDVGLIMARRLTLEGAKVEAVVEIMPYPGGLSRNVVQCLLDYEIPLLLRHTVTRIHGRDRVEGVSVAQVDEELNPISGTERFIPCDTLLLSVGLIPENELSRKAGILIDPATSGPIVDETFETSTPSIYACGNVVYVHDLVDDVTEEGY